MPKILWETFTGGVQTAKFSLLREAATSTCYRVIHINFVCKIFVRNFRVTIFSFISVRTINSQYIVLLVKI